MKRLPIIILLENHLDYTVSALQGSFLNVFQALGYNSLCYEFANCKDSTAVIKELTGVIANSEEILGTILSNLQKCDININRDELLNKSFPELCNFLHEYFSDKYFIEPASYICSIKSAQEKLQCVESFKDSMNIIGIDFHTTGALEDAKTDFLIRETHMASYLETLFRHGQNPIFITGKLHALGLSRILQEKGLLQHTLFLDLSSVDGSLTASEAFLSELEFLERSDIIHKIAVNVNGSKDEFLNLFSAVIQLVKDYTVDENTTKRTYKECKQRAFLIGYSLACAATGLIGYVLTNQMHTQNDQISTQNNTCPAFTLW